MNLTDRVKKLQEYKPDDVSNKRLLEGVSTDLQRSLAHFKNHLDCQPDSVNWPNECKVRIVKNFLNSALRAALIFNIDPNDLLEPEDDPNYDLEVN